MAIQQVHGQSQGVMGGGIKCDCTIACTASNHFVLLLRFASSATPDIFLAATWRVMGCRVSGWSAKMACRVQLYHFGVNNPTVDCVLVLIQQRQQKRIVDCRSPHCLWHHQVEYKQNFQLVIQRKSTYPTLERRQWSASVESPSEAQAN